MNTLLAVNRLAYRHVPMLLFKTLCLPEIYLLARGILTCAHLLMPAIISNTKCRQVKCDITRAEYGNEHTKANITYLSFLVTNNVNKKSSIILLKLKNTKWINTLKIVLFRETLLPVTEKLKIHVRLWQHIFQYTLSNIKSNHVHPFPCHLIPLLDISCFPKCYNENQGSWQNSSLSELPYLSLVERSFVKFYSFSPLLWPKWNSDIYCYKKCKGNSSVISSQRKYHAV